MFEESYCMYNVTLPWDSMADYVIQATGTVEFEDSLWLYTLDSGINVRARLLVSRHFSRGHRPYFIQ